MAKFKTTDKTPMFWRGRARPEPGTTIEADPAEVKYEVSLGILEPASGGSKKAKASKPVPTEPEAIEREDDQQDQEFKIDA